MRRKKAPRGIPVGLKFLLWRAFISVNAMTLLWMFRWLWKLFCSNLQLRQRLLISAKHLVTYSATVPFSDIQL